MPNALNMPMAEWSRQRPPAGAGVMSEADRRRAYLASLESPEVDPGIGAATADQEAVARAAGYPSYEAMMLRQRQRGQTAGTGERSNQMNDSTANAMRLHPAAMFDYIKNALAGVNGQ